MFAGPSSPGSVGCQERVLRHWSSPSLRHRHSCAVFWYGASVQGPGPGHTSVSGGQFCSHTIPAGFWAASPLAQVSALDHWPVWPPATGCLRGSPELCRLPLRASAGQLPRSGPAPAPAPACPLQASPPFCCRALSRLCAVHGTTQLVSGRHCAGERGVLSPCT